MFQNEFSSGSRINLPGLLGFRDWGCGCREEGCLLGVQDFRIIRLRFRVYVSQVVGYKLFGRACLRACCGVILGARQLEYFKYLLGSGLLLGVSGIMCSSLRGFYTL